MGEIADMMINGFLCSDCGSHIDFEEPGHPRTCDDCEQEDKNIKRLVLEKARRETK